VTRRGYPLAVAIAGFLLVWPTRTLPAVIAWYRFDDGPVGAIASSTTIPDGSGNGLDGVARNDSLDPLAYTTDAALGDFALDATADGEYVEVPDSGLSRPTGDFTLELFTRATPETLTLDTPVKALVRKAAVPPPCLVNPCASYGIFYNQSTGIFSTAVGIPGALTGVGSTHAFLDDGLYHHVAAVFDQGGLGAMATLSLYVDGELEGMSTFVYDPITYADQPLYIGAGNDQGSLSQVRRNFIGVIDEVRLSDQALDPSQFLQVPEPTWGGAVGCLTAAVIAALRKRRRRLSAET
jgi:hypothetical protein